jgi:hypothetical protein
LNSYSNKESAEKQNKFAKSYALLQNLFSNFQKEIYAWLDADAGIKSIMQAIKQEEISSSNFYLTITKKEKNTQPKF